MKKNKIFSILLMLVVLAGSIGIIGCDDDDKQSNKIELLSFGPSPALRGGELRFIGKNMDKVEQVVLPEGITISDFTMSTPEEIRIEIPQEAMPGYVTLLTPRGELKTKTRLSFSEPIFISRFSPASAKPGDEITIEGDYLNLIGQVVFAQDVMVEADAFLSQTRQKITLNLPIEARTGKFSITNGAEMPIVVYSNDELVVALPSILEVNPNPIKPGGTVTINGNLLELVESLVFGGDKVVTEFTLASDKKSITAKTPFDMKDGAVTLVSFSGVEVEGTNVLETILPIVEELYPLPAKNMQQITITGTDLDLVSGVGFGAFEATIQSKTSTQLVVVVPEKAVSGVLELQTLSGKTVATEVVELVEPSITAISPLSLVAGNDITITGTHLDLVRKVRFANGIEVEVTPSQGSSLTLTVPTSAQSGAIELVALNETVVASDDQLQITSPNVPVISTITPQVKPGDMLIITGSKLNLVETVVFMNDQKATSYGNRTANLLEVVVPEASAKGTVSVKLVTFDGIEITSPEFVISGLDSVQNPALVFFDFDAGDASIGWNDVGGIAGTGNKYYHVDINSNGGWAVYFMRNWGKFSTQGITASDVIKMDVNIENVDPAVVLKIRMKGSVDDYWYAWKVGELYPSGTSGWVTVTIPLSAFRNNNGDGSGVITDPSTLGSEYGIAHGWGAGHITMSIDNMRFEKK